MSDEPLTPQGLETAQSPTTPSTAPSPAPGDPEYDAFLLEVQRLADERQAAQGAERRSWSSRTVVTIIALAIVWVIGVALVLWAGWLRISTDGSTTAPGAATTLVAAGLGIACLVLGSVGMLRVVHRRSD